MHTLASYLIQQLPGGKAYPDARQLCLRLYCTADGVPEVLRPQLSRLGLTDSFAELARAGWIREAAAQVTESGHWVEVIASVLQRAQAWWTSRVARSWHARLVLFTRVCHDT